MDTTKLKYQKTHFLTKILLFYLNKCSPDSCKTLLISRVLKTVDADSFASILGAFIKEKILRYPYSFIPADVTANQFQR